MRDRANLLWTKLRLAATTIVSILSQWRYLLLACIIAILFFELTYWLFNLPFLGVILASSNVGFGEKLAVLASPFASIAQVSGLYTVILMVLLSLAQGISIAMLAYVVKHQKKLDAELLGGSSLVSLLALVGIGCPACGTSLLTPIVALFVSGSAVALSEKIMVFLLPFALIVGVYGLYAIGLKTATIHRRIHAAHNNKVVSIINNV